MKIESLLNVILASVIAFNMGKKRIKLPVFFTKGDEEVNTDEEKSGTDEDLSFILPTIGVVEDILKAASDIMQSNGRVSVADLFGAFEREIKKLDDAEYNKAIAAPRGVFMIHIRGWTIDTYLPTITPYTSITGKINGYILRLPKPRVLSEISEQEEKNG